MIIYALENKTWAWLRYSPRDVSAPTKVPPLKDAFLIAWCNNLAKLRLSPSENILIRQPGTVLKMRSLTKPKPS